MQEDVAELKTKLAVLEEKFKAFEDKTEAEITDLKDELEEERGKRRRIGVKLGEAQKTIAKVKFFRDIVITAFVVIGFVLNFLREQILGIFGNTPQG